MIGFICVKMIICISHQAFKYISEFIENKEKYLKTSPKKKNYMNRIIGDLSNNSSNYPSSRLS